MVESLFCAIAFGDRAELDSDRHPAVPLMYGEALNPPHGLIGLGGKANLDIEL